MEDFLQKFRDAKERDYGIALMEVKAGKKRTHWIWYIFPQIQGLGFSYTSEYYAIRNLEEAREYLKDPVLGARLEEISRALLDLQADDILEVFGYPDNLKVCSCMTLFEAADLERKIFADVLEKFFHGERDARTLELLEKNTGETR